MLNRWIEEDGLKDYAYENGLGLAVFSPLAQGLLTDKYLKTNTCVSDSLKDRLVSAAIHTDVMGSDHCPVEVVIGD